MKRITLSLISLFLLTLLCFSACSTEQIPFDSSSAISADTSSSFSSDSSNTVLNGTGNTDESSAVESSNGTSSENNKLPADYYPILIRQTNNDSLLFIGAFSDGELRDYEELGIAELDTTDEFDDVLAFDNKTETYDYTTDLVSVGDELTLYSSSGEKIVHVTRVYVYFYRAAYPWIYVDIDAETDNGQNYLCSKSGLNPFVANEAATAVAFDLDSDGKTEQITLSFANEGIEENEIACFYNISVKGATIDSERKFGGWVPAIEDEQYTIKVICDFDSDGIFEIVDYSNAYDDSANIWSVKENKLERLLHWS